VKLHGLSETKKPVDRSLIAGRIILLHEVLARGLDSGVWNAKRLRKVVAHA
jgi:hypothetical protein